MKKHTSDVILLFEVEITLTMKYKMTVYHTRLISAINTEDILYNVYDLLS